MEFERNPVAPQALRPASNFAAGYAGEHVAGTEFVIGALFVAWGVSANDILVGLLLGNLLAVLTWSFVTAPIAVDTRLTLYAYLERIAGPGMIKVYSVVNGILFCILAGSMITVSASAVRVLFGIPVQVNWYPTAPGFVAVAVVVGAVVVAIAAKGFKRVAAFAEICSPWMIVMFVAGALALWPVLTASSGTDDFLAVASEYIWVERDTGVGFWHVAAFAWVCNLAMHGSLGDLTLLRFAKSWTYGFYSGLGMFIGHYVAWICAGIMGAAAALVLKSTITQLDPGAVAFQALGVAGILTVIIAGWTTSNPTIYRAGLAFQSLNHGWKRSTVTIIAGIATTIIACFPFVFTKLLDFVGIMGLMLAPVGAVIVTEHWLFPRIGLTRYWSHYRKQALNLPSILTWGLSLLLALYLERSGVLHLFFLLIPIWLFATVTYIVLASSMGARAAYPEAKHYEAAERTRKQAERQFLDRRFLDKRFPEQRATDTPAGSRRSGDPVLAVARLVAILALIACFGMAIQVFLGGSLDSFRTWLIAPTLAYFVAATVWIVRKEREADTSGPDAVTADATTFN